MPHVDCFPVQIRGRCDRWELLPQDGPLAGSMRRCLVMLFFAALALFAAHSGAQEVSSENTELLESLPEDVKQRVLDSAESQSRSTRAERAPLESNPDERTRDAVKNADATDREVRRLEPNAEFVLRSGDTVLLDVRPRSSRDLPQEAQQDKEMKDRQVQVWMSGNPYVLDDSGRLWIDGIQGIPLGGLTVSEAARRLESMRAFRDFIVEPTLLPAKPTDVDALKPFGYDIFRNNQSPAADGSIAPPAQYVLGPGDELEVQLFGAERGKYTLPIGRNGWISLPKLGPLTVGGSTFDEARTLIERNVAERMTGTSVSVALRELRSIRVFVLGEVERPGSYLVSNLSTITNALYASGGISQIGSLRNIQLKRAGSLVTTLDAYQLLLSGDSRNDQRITEGDVILVPPIDVSVSVAGAVRRPAIYELQDRTSCGDVLRLAGGNSANADLKYARVERISAQGERSVIDVDLSTDAGRAFALAAGDVLRVPTIKPTLENSVNLSGYVYRPGDSEYRAGMRLTNVLTSIDDLRPRADPHYIVINRERPSDGVIEVLSADLLQALANRSGPNNLELRPRDRISVLAKDVGRQRDLAPLFERLRLQSSLTDPARVVSVNGRVKAPGEYPLERGMSVSDLLRAGGGLDDSAYGGTAELTRYHVLNGDRREAEVTVLDLAAALRGDAAADLVLKPYDSLNVLRVTNWSAEEYITLSGEVRFPGNYVITNGETLGSVLKRAGGLTSLGYPAGAVFTRNEIRDREKEQIQQLTERMQSDLALLAVQTSAEEGKSDSQSTLAAGQALLGDLQRAEPVGRLVLDLGAVLSGSEDIELAGGDRLVVPRQPSSVLVMGEVQSSASHRWQARLGRADYIGLSGGLTRKADKGKIYIVRADGSVNGVSSRWYGGEVKMMPGDAIVVPINIDRMRPIPLWTSVTQILYNLAVAAAAVNSF